MTSLADINKAGHDTYAYLSQADAWKPKGRPAVAVATMDPDWRRNAARWMERRAGYFAMLYGFGEMYVLGSRTMRTVIGEVNGEAVEGGPLFSHLDMMSDHVRDALDEEQARRDADPVAWIRTTALYRALVADLPSGVPA
jgi:hypothetical protein